MTAKSEIIAAIQSKGWKLATDATIEVCGEVRGPLTFHADRGGQAMILRVLTGSKHWTVLRDGIGIETIPELL